MGIISLVTLKTILQNDMNIESVMTEMFFAAFSFFVKEKTEKEGGGGKLAERTYQKIFNVCFIPQYVAMTGQNSLLPLTRTKFYFSLFFLDVSV